MINVTADFFPLLIAFLILYFAFRQLKFLFFHVHWISSSKRVQRAISFKCCGCFSARLSSSCAFMFWPQKASSSSRSKMKQATLTATATYGLPQSVTFHTSSQGRRKNSFFFKQQSNTLQPNVLCIFPHGCDLKINRL